MPECLICHATSSSSPFFHNSSASVLVVFQVLIKNFSRSSHDDYYRNHPFEPPTAPTETEKLSKTLQLRWMQRTRYRCVLCDYDLHTDCAFANSTPSHNFFKSCTFKFLPQRPSKMLQFPLQCDACGNLIHGFVYHCESKGWDLHPCCRNLVNELDIDGVKLRLCGKISSKCVWCKQINPVGSVKGTRGWSYVSKCENYRFHVFCATEMVNQVWKNGDNMVSDKCLSIETVKLPLPVSLNRSGGNYFMRIVKVFLKTIAGILLGDPTITLASIFVELASNG